MTRDCSIRTSTRLLPIAILTVLISTVLPLADEGMWTFDNPPRKQWKERYDFEPADTWLDREETVARADELKAWTRAADR